MVRCLRVLTPVEDPRVSIGVVKRFYNWRQVEVKPLEADVSKFALVEARIEFFKQQSTHSRIYTS